MNRRIRILQRPKPSKAVSREDFAFEKEITDFHIECPICLHVIMDGPHQSLCCGRHFCKACISEVKIDRYTEVRSCPICRGDCSEIFPDKNFERIVYSKIVYCMKRNRTQETQCDWSGELRDFRNHLSTSCPYDIEKCKYECGQKDILRIDLSDHLENHCLLRPYSCQHCGAKSTYKTITKSHYQVCKNYPVGCSHCSDKNVRRSELNQHVKDKCPMQRVECAFSWLGCEEWPLRKDAKKHYSDFHHEALSQSYRKLRDDTEQLRLDTNKLRLDTKLDMSICKNNINALYDSLEDKTDSLKEENAELKDEMDERINRRCRDLERDLKVLRKDHDDLLRWYSKLVDDYESFKLIVGTLLIAIIAVLLAFFLYYNDFHHTIMVAINDSFKQNNKYYYKY